MICFKDRIKGCPCFSERIILYVLHCKWPGRKWNGAGGRGYKSSIESISLEDKSLEDKSLEHKSLEIKSLEQKSWEEIISEHKSLEQNITKRNFILMLEWLCHNSWSIATAICFQRATSSKQFLIVVPCVVVVYCIKLECQ